MKNIHVLPTDKSSRLHLIEDVLMFTNEYKNSVCDSEVNIYITNEEEIKEGDWYLNIEEKNGIKNPFYGKLYKANYSIKSVNTDYRHNLKKIILTTDTNLIKDGVQAIDDEFLKWFVKNPSCESVEIENTCLEIKVCDCAMNENCLKPGYKIIIPQEESKQENCCTPVSQIKRYVDCVGCDKKPKEMSKQTVIEWIQHQVKQQGITHYFSLTEILEQAKEMEKEQIIEAHLHGMDFIPVDPNYKGDAENYYNETYKNKNNV
jgi:hypothetical protein